ncbi:hypothetical protein OOZ15_11865 [Galbibacter sp. EGI 63066]|uniref:MauE/DoxX family redox-associated membrane protein n=1 Tax=Galbibacter sp. EGI 63066 TaxID=2993559 RepID=UPI0022487FF7|nr:MauE/DoxX family redox-associated membrane protein [Galbibacter sp. EGI 63066]MCX2680640.1 hypothetical protein [Galbibacter sp. EGI 63066]
MKWRQKHKNIIVEIISFLFILLFVYAAISKLLDFENFQIQLGQSPMLSAYAGMLAWMVPVLELLIALLLAFSKSRTVGLLGSLTLMVMFSAYIYIILGFGAFVPCSCGGVLEKMGWKEHLVFNLVFVLLAVIALQLSIKPSQTLGQKHKKLLVPLSLCLFGILTVSGMFLSSERMIYHENPFIRRYSHGIPKTADIELKGNAYYFAGTNAGTIYLGNYSSPLWVTLIDTALQTKEVKIIKAPERDLPSIAAQVRIKEPYFYLIDGQISRILKGNTSDWNTIKRMDGSVQFSDYQIIGNDSLAIKAYNSNEDAYSLGAMQIKDSLPYTLSPGILEKQVDGIFDVDGTLSYDTDTKELVYVYYYRNGFTVTDKRLNLKRRGHTIDTIGQAQLKIDTVQTNSRNQRKLISSLMVNPSSFANNGLLYVRSKIKGRYEPPKTWEQTETIDVYELSTGNYRTSFYIYKESGALVRRFFVIGDHFYGFAGNKLVRYDLKRML